METIDAPLDRPQDQGDPDQEKPRTDIIDHDADSKPDTQEIPARMSGNFSANPGNMFEKPISLGINVSILVILTIFCVLLSLPLRLLLDTNYYTQSSLKNETEAPANGTLPEVVLPLLDHRKLKLCPKFEYQERLRSVFRSDYDGNCTYAREQPPSDTRSRNKPSKGDALLGPGEKARRTKDILENLTDNVEESAKIHRAKPIPIAVHILVAMLVILAIGTFVEALRIYFTKLKLKVQQQRH